MKIRTEKMKTGSLLTALLSLIYVSGQNKDEKFKTVQITCKPEPVVGSVLYKENYSKSFL